MQTTKTPYLTICLAAIFVLGLTLQANGQTATTKGATMGVFVDLRADKTAADIKALGLSWVRIMYHWTWLEQSPGKFG